jgi:hypothetical protein
MEIAQQSKDMASRWATIDPEFMLNRDNFDVVDVQKVGRAPVGIDLDLVNLKTYSGWIIVAFRTIIDRAYDALAFRELRSNGLADVLGKGGNSASARKMISNKGDLFNSGSRFRFDLRSRAMNPHPVHYSAPQYTLSREVSSGNSVFTCRVLGVAFLMA